MGVAMNVKGTDVSREDSDVILLDDNFATIVAAVNEGRVIYDNIKKFIKFLISANFGELLLIFFAVLFSLPLPLLPLQILWVNLVTDSLPALALGVDPPEGGVMKRKPRPPEESIFSRTKFFIIASGILFFLSSLLLFYFEYKTTGSLEKARTVTLTAVILFELFLVFSCRSEKSIFQIGFFSNPYLVGAITIVIILQLLLIYSPFGVLFKLVPLSLGEWGYAILAGLSGFLFFEIKKMTQRNY